MMKSTKCGGKYCSVVGCNKNQVRDTPKGIQFFLFPRNEEKREAWLKAIRRRNPDGSSWIPGNQAVVCSDHFVGNTHSKDKDHPSYAPTIFPNRKYKKSRSLAALARYHRAEKRRHTAPTTNEKSLKELRPALDEFNQRFSPFLWLRIRCEGCHQEITSDDLFLVHYLEHGRVIVKHMEDQKNETKIKANSDGEQSEEDEKRSVGGTFDSTEMVSNVMDDRDIMEETVEEYQAPKVVLKSLKHNSVKEKPKKELDTIKVEDAGNSHSHHTAIDKKKKKKKYEAKNTKYFIQGRLRYKASKGKSHSATATVEDNIRLDEWDPIVMPTRSTSSSTIKLAYIKDSISNQEEDRMNCYVACNVCDRFFDTTQQLSLHRNQFHARNFSYLTNYIFNDTAHENRLGETISDDSSESSEEDDNVTRHLENMQKEFMKVVREKEEKNHLECMCEYCSKIFKNRSLLSCHIKTVHLAKMKGYEELQHYCDRCTFKTAYKKMLQLHIMHVHEGVPRKKYKRKKTYHYKPVKNRKKKKPKARTPKQFVCKYCSWVGNRNSKLTYHIEKKHFNIN